MNNMWDDLVELMETRRQLLETTLRRHRYFADADELGSRFAEKREAAENAKDIGGIVNEIQSLEPKVKITSTSYGTNKLSPLNFLKMAERSEAKGAKQRFATINLKF